MRSKKIKFGAILLLCVCLMLVAALLVLQKKDESAYSCYYIPVGDGKLSWGMSKEEIIAVMGEPASVEDKEYGFDLTYDILIPSKLGSCSNLILYVGLDNSTEAEQQTVKCGLVSLEMEIYDTTEETVIEKLSTFYGNLTGGSTQMELDLQKADPDYFNKRYYCNEWMLGTLPEEEYNQLVQLYQKITEGILLDEGKSLMYIRISGIEVGDAYTCNVSLDANILSCIESGEK